MKQLLNDGRKFPVLLMIRGRIIHMKPIGYLQDAIADVNEDPAQLPGNRVIHKPIQMQHDLAVLSGPIRKAMGLD